ncbi:MAG: ATP-dependent DNA helicase RecG [Sphingobacteriales bacterium]|nr:ATP-dependent DNA helicase RecG [Sphingobacteriales bacterium]
MALNPTALLLETPIEYLKGIGPQKGELLRAELNLISLGDLLEHYPFRYIDKTQIYPIGQINPSTQLVQIKGVLGKFEELGEGRTRRLAATLSDDTGSIELVWFQGFGYVKQYLTPGKIYLVFGKPSQFGAKFSISHPEITPFVTELADNTETNTATAKYEPVYSSTEKLKTRFLDSKGIYKLIRNLFEKLQPEKDLPEFLPEEIRQHYKLINRADAYRYIHFPETEAQIAAAQRRIKFEEFFLLQLRILLSRNSNRQNNQGWRFPALEYFNSFYNQHLPFALTNAQKRVLREIRSDTLAGKQMNRLLQGDVGSGKTIVSLMAMLMAIDNNCQACLMAPTEILAQQHANKIGLMLQNLPITVGLLTGSTKAKARKELLPRLANGELQVLIGTHALLEDPVQFNKLGMVVIDEQHRFGVAQRARLWAKTTVLPHVLVMSATPIPRTLAMTIYGDLDVSIIDELPPGRKPIKTVHYSERQRQAVFDFMRHEIALGRQVYIVYPLIKESEALSYKNLMQGYEMLSFAFPQPTYTISVVHGKLSPSEKEAEMQRFKQGLTQIMLATTVIEVGVDVPNASVMIIESAERFGLSQLHQLRGRVGRGAAQSYCVLLTGDKLTHDARVRMRTMVATTDGFKIAEVDMQLRGPGDLDGTQQSGLVQFKLADIVKDSALLAEARAAASKLLDADANMQNPDNHNLKQFYEAWRRESRSKWSRIS